jgi:ABC-type branched-subunit amino acid transport system ATPase component
MTDDADPGPAQTPILEARDCTVRFGGLVALNHADICVPRETIIGLVGPNGAGKSTFFGVLSGIQRANTGTVFLKGTDVSRSTPQARAQSGLLRTFQQPELFIGLTVREHLAFSYRIHHARHRIWRDIFDGRAWFGKDPAEQEVVGSLISSLGIERIADRDVNGLPLGLSRLVEIGRALAAAPSLVLLDEASSGLDHHERERLVDVLGNVPKNFGSSLLIVEHDVELVLGLSKRVYVLDFGTMIAEGTPDEIRHNNAVKAAYLGGEITEEEVAG